LGVTREGGWWCHSVVEGAGRYLMTTQHLTDEEVYRKYGDDLVRFAMGLVGRSDGPDVVSEAMLRVLSSDSWESVVNQRAYLYRAVLNEASNTHRERQRRWARELRVVDGGVADPVEYRPEVLGAVMRLSVRQRAVIVLAYWEQLTPSEIATRLGVSEGSVRRHLARGRSKLRRVLND
jgi:RNA polymerase sigma factor (sigma-70 family)